MQRVIGYFIPGYFLRGVGVQSALPAWLSEYAAHLYFVEGSRDL